MFLLYVAFRMDPFVHNDRGNFPRPPLRTSGGRAYFDVAAYYAARQLHSPDTILSGVSKEIELIFFPIYVAARNKRRLFLFSVYAWSIHDMVSRTIEREIRVSAGPANDLKYSG